MEPIKDEVDRLMAEIKEDLRRKDETYRLIADSKPDNTCMCISCSFARLRKSWDEGMK